MIDCWASATETWPQRLLTRFIAVEGKSDNLERMMTMQRQAALLKRDLENRPTLLHPGDPPRFDDMHPPSSAKASARQVQRASVSTLGKVMSDDWFARHKNKLFKLP